MKIETKFNLGSKFWALKDHKAIEMVVGNIAVDATDKGTTISYRPKNEGNGLGYDYISAPFKEDNCYKSREDLIASI